MVNKLVDKIIKSNFIFYSFCLIIAPLLFSMGFVISAWSIDIFVMPRYEKYGLYLRNDLIMGCEIYGTKYKSEEFNISETKTEWMPCSEYKKYIDKISSNLGGD